MRPQTTHRQIPLRYKEAVKVIWQKFGGYEFIFNSLSSVIADGPGIIRRMKNEKIILDCGRVMSPIYSANTRKWKLSQESCEICKREYGPAPNNADENSAQSIEKYKDHLLSYNRHVPEKTIDMENSKTKICSRCKKEQPIEEFQSRFNSSSGLKIRMRNICRNCRNKQKREKAAQEKAKPTPKLSVKIPRRYEDATGEIWRLVGQNRFMWCTISGLTEHCSRMTPSHLREAGIMLDHGWVVPHQKTRVWQFKPTLVEELTNYFGPANPDADELCRTSIEEFIKAVNTYNHTRAHARYERETHPQAATA